MEQQRNFQCRWRVNRLGLSRNKTGNLLNTPFSTICLGMKVDQHLSFIKTDKTADSLMSLIADGNHRDTFLGRNTWKKLIGSQASLRCNCNMEGFNVVGTTPRWSRARIGILSNIEKDYSNCDSRIGFGTEESTTILVRVATKH